MQQYIAESEHRNGKHPSATTTTRVVVSEQTNPGDGCDQYERPDLNGKETPYLADTHLGNAPITAEILATYPDYNRRISMVASSMRLVAYRLGGAQVGFVPKSKNVRYAIASLNFQLTEMANSIASRNSILQRLLDICAQGVTPVDEKKLSSLCHQPGRKLPTSDYLRDVEPTRFIDAFDWFNASLPSFGTGALKLGDRARAMKSLTEDYYWEKVNEVYASGQGDVAMAFIKDELGNWNLKSYSNDPSKLLAAYRGVANAAISAATQLARKASGDPTALVKSNRALDLADRLATGQSAGAANIGGLRLEELRQRIVGRLETARARFSERQDALLGALQPGGIRSGGAVDSLTAQVAAKTAATESFRSSLGAAEQAKGATEAALARCSETGNCSDEAAKVATAIAAVSSARADYTNSAGAQRRAEDELAVAKAEADHLGDRAAELADEILQDYQRDLSILQQVVANEAAGSSN